jgi:phage gp36-like protein
MIQIKQPAEKFVYLYDFAPLLGGAAIVEILAVTSAARGGGAALVELGRAVEGAAVKLMWGGGADGESYLTSVRIRDASAQELELDGEIAVIEAGWTMPDGGAPWLSIADFVARFGLEETVRMTDEAGTGRIDRNLLVGALTAAQAIAEVHVSAIYALPLSVVPEIVKLAVGDIARARLYRRGAPEGVAEQAKAQTRLLERIGEGKLPLPALTRPAAAPSSTPILVAPGERVYPRGRWSDY